ncbi:MAG: hypothetical protein ACT4OE_06445 [Sphingosinicella sp.]
MSRPSMTEVVTAKIRERIAGWPENPDKDDLNKLLRLLAQWRSQMISRTQVHVHGTAVAGGPFAGMTYVAHATEGSLIARLLGTYESELHPHLLRIAARPPQCVVNVGCAEGYYAVGLARLMPATIVHAFDIDPKAQDACRALAGQNLVADRVVVGGAFAAEDFQAFAGKRTLVILDVEGAEIDLLRPDLAPALAAMDIIVETHDVACPGTLAALTARFAASHDIVRVDQQPKQYQLPAWLAEMGHLDQLLAVWEWRLKPTPWLVMRPRRRRSWRSRRDRRR